MRILFVVKSKAIETLGPMYLSAVVKAAGHEAKIVDIDQALTIYFVWKPHMVGYSVMTGDQERFKQLEKTLAKISRHQVLWGGPHVTFFPQDFEAETGSKISGEAEGKLARLIGSGDLYPDIDSIPWPDRSDFPNMRIRDFLASRGCPHACGYCYNSAWKRLFPGALRVRDPIDVVREVAFVRPQFAYFQDSCFGVNPEWMEKFCHAYRGTLQQPYHCHLRPAQVDNERARLLSISNCQSVKIALETGSDRLRELINRGHTNNEDAIIASNILRKWSIKLMLQNILGLPTATIEEDLETLRVNIQCRPAYAWASIFQPYPGTDLGDMCKRRGWYKGDYSEISDSFFDATVLEFDEEHKEQIEVLQRVFALCVEHQYVPEISELRRDNLGKLVHKIMRITGDKRMGF